jgi:hypothetical protein
LLAIADSISSPRELTTLLDHLGGLLHQLLEYDFVAVWLTDPETAVTRLLSIESRLQTRLRYDGLEFPTAGTHIEASFTTQSPILVSDVETEPHLPQNLAILREHGIQSYVLVPLTTAVRRLGVLSFFSLRLDAYANADVEFVQRVAAQMALAIDNALNFAHAERHHRELTDQRDRLARAARSEQCARGHAPPAAAHPTNHGDARQSRPLRPRRPHALRRGVERAAHRRAHPRRATRGQGGARPGRPHSARRLGAGPRVHVEATTPADGVRTGAIPVSVLTPSTGSASGRPASSRC